MDFRFAPRFSKRFSAIWNSSAFQSFQEWFFKRAFPVFRKAAFWSSVGISCFVAVSYASVEIAAFGRTYFEPDSIPKNAVGLVLGTSAKTSDWRPNAYFSSRIEAAAELYREKRVDCLLVSWDNSTRYYNEIKSMQLALMERGVPPERIFGDYAGFRTLDSVVRAKEVFWLSRFTVVSQSSHAKRAVFLARLSGSDAIAFKAASPSFFAWPVPVLREFPARMLAFYEAVLVEMRPKFLGKNERIETDPTVRPVPPKVCYPR